MVGNRGLSSVRDSLLRLMFLRTAQGFAPGGKSCVSDLIDERSVADLQRLRRLSPVPVIRVQRFENHILLEFADGILRDSFQRNRCLPF